ncbi:GNAT family N-acetyltransferase [Fulvivirga lutimaris]|uniref:GNAT family N-acetyltransferase n=1 Tax=Fulvivirga lutimaris TaxID=1819566 RepID=UPI0012BC7342|nr:GNAT family N-acetyltransferase [Fulvivirga lutimaris]MTI40152.1 N-acetyltransferase [Fulvivirga lutimaris]
MNIRPYKSDDKQELLDLLKLNIPKYFAQEELNDLEEYLKDHLEYYYVVEVDNQLVGAGGINTTDRADTVRISWDFFHPECQGKGFGSALLKYRIEEIKRMKFVKVIEVRTSQLVYQFYQKLGFELIETVKDFWADGFDLYQMKQLIKH